MDDRTVEELGPVDYMVVEFPLDKANFTGEVASELASLVEAGLIQLLDLLFITKDADGVTEAFEMHELDEDQVGALRALDNMALELLAEEDVDAIAEALEHNSIAAVLVWENTWAAPFASSCRRAGGQLVASGRIPVQGILAALEADEDISTTEGA